MSTKKAPPTPTQNHNGTIPLGKSLLPPEVLEQCPDDLPDAAAFIFWSGWQRGSAARDVYWEAELERRLGSYETRFVVGRDQAPPALDVLDDIKNPPDITSYETEQKKQRVITAAPPGPGEEAPIGAFTGPTVLQFVEYAVNNSSDKMRARLIARELLEENKENYPSGIPPGSTLRWINDKLKEEGIQLAPVQHLGDGGNVSDEDVEESNFG